MHKRSDHMIYKNVFTCILLFQVLVYDSRAQTDTAATVPRINEGEIYKLKPVVDIPIIAIGAGWSAFAFPKIYSKDRSTDQEILALDKNDIPAFDRWVAGNTNPKADKTSDFFMYGSIMVPFTLLLDKEIRKDAFKIAVLYLEAMSVTGLYYTGTPYFIDRYRPETYNTSLPLDERTTGNNKNSFLGGHPACVSTAVFFTAKVYADYHPESNFKYFVYGFAIATTGTTVYLRHSAGKHFPSDLLTGVTLGTLTGILVPHFHKISNGKNKNLGVIPYTNGSQHGMYLSYRW